MIYINITISVASKVGGGATLKIRNLDKQKKRGITVMLLSESSKTILNKQNKQNKQTKKSCNY